MNANIGDCQLGKSQIRELIPHSGTMCLLDAVVKWDDESIVCLTETHRDSTNPLRRNDQLSALHAFEYGAQATAVHGGLRARAVGKTAPPGYVAALRNAVLFAERLDDLEARLEVKAERLFGDGADTVYDFEILAAGKVIARATVTIMRRPG